MTFVSRKYKFIFLHIPKCAGVSIEASMYDAGIINDLEWSKIKGINKFLSKVRKRLPLISGKPKWGMHTLSILEYLHSGHLRYLDLVPHITELKQYKIYTITRDPVEACISRFNYINSKSSKHQGHRLKGNRYSDFDTFLKSLQMINDRSQFSYIFNAAGEKPQNCRLFDIENIKSFRIEFAENHGILLDIKHKNKGKKQKFKPNKAQIELIKKIYNYDYKKIYID